MDFEISPKDLKVRNGIMDQFLNNTFDSSVLVDENGYVITIGKGASQLTLTTKEDMTGKHITYFDKTSPFAEVIETGKMKKNILSVLYGRRCLQTIYPVKWEGKVVGAIGTLNYTDIDIIRKQLVLNNSDVNQKTYDEQQDIKARLQRNYIFEDYIGENTKVIDMLKECENAATSSYTILLLGETGTGKEILASAIHSQRMKGKNSPYVKINCTAIPNDLLESELFGYEKGAFTGAITAKKGRFEIASGGSILLDEIGDMDMRLQGKLLRVLEEREFERIGSVKTIPLEAQVIASTNSNLIDKCREGKFRQDLYYRLNTIEIRIPPLRDRVDDIPLLVNHFIRREGLAIRITDSTMQVLMQYKWPGNVRELRNIIQRLGVSKNEETITPKDVMKYLTEYYYLNPVPKSEDKVFTNTITLDSLEKQHIIKILKEVNYNMTNASKELGITRTTLYNKLKKYRIDIKKEV